MSISIAMCTYNGERYLREQLDSLLAQSKPFDQLVVCDDRSTDSTPDILREYSAHDPRIEVHINESSLGFKKNFEKAVSLCTGECIALSDQDDIWLPEHLEVLSRNLPENGAVCGVSLLVDAEGRDMGITFDDIKNFRYKKHPDSLTVAWYMTFHPNPFQGAAMMLSRSFVQKALPIPDCTAFHDVYFAYLASLMGVFRFIKDPVILYRQHGDNASGKYRRTSRLRHLAVRILTNKVRDSRAPLFYLLKERLEEDADPATAAMMERVDRYFRDTRTPAGRVRNLLFELSHFPLLNGDA